MKTNQPNQDGKSEQPTVTSTSKTPKSWDRLHDILHHLITSENTDYVIDIVGGLGNHLLYLAAMFPEKKFIANNLHPSVRGHIAIIEKMDIDSLLKDRIKPLTPLANPKSMTLHKNMLELEKKVLEQKNILFEKDEPTAKIISSYDPKNLYVIPLARLTPQAATKVLADFKDKKCPYLAVFQSKTSDPLPFDVQGNTFFDVIDFSGSTPIRWFFYTNSAAANDIKALFLEAYAASERWANSRIMTIQSQLKKAKDPAEIKRLNEMLQSATVSLNFITESFKNSALNEKQSLSKTLPASEATTPENPKRKFIGPEPAPRQTKASQQPASARPSPSQKAAPAFFVGKGYSAAEIKNQTLQAEMMELGTQFHQTATLLSNADLTKPGASTQIMKVLEILKSKTNETVEKAKKVVNAITPETSDSVVEITETHPKRHKSKSGDEQVTVHTTEPTTQPEKLSISFLMN